MSQTDRQRPELRQAVQRRLLPSLSVLTLTVFANYAALLAILLPNQIEAIDPDRKVTNLAIVTSVSFAFTILAQPLVGALSDRTRSRLGRRTPWMLGGSIVAGAFLLGLGGLGSILWICIFWVIIQFALNATDIASSALIPDRFPRERRGRASAILSLGAMAGGAVGTFLAGALAENHLSLAYTILGLGVVAATAVFVTCNREASTLESHTRNFHWPTFLRGFVLNPREHPDFAWAFASRFLFIVSYYLVLTYQLYILTDYVDLTKTDANDLIGLLTVAGFAMTLVGAAIGGWWSDRIGRRTIFLIAASGILMVALAIPLISGTVEAMIGFAIVQGFAMGVYMSCGPALVIDVLPHQGVSAAKDLGIYNIATNIPQVVAPALAALAIHIFDGYRPLFALAIICAAASAILIARVKTVR